MKNKGRLKRIHFSNGNCGIRKDLWQKFKFDEHVAYAEDALWQAGVIAAGFSIVWVEFHWGTEIYKARQIVSEKLGILANAMPEGVSSPILAPQTSIMGEIMLVALTSDSLSMQALRDLADRQVKQRLLSVTGVSQIIVMGGEPLEYQILANPLKMDYFDVSLEEMFAGMDDAEGALGEVFGGEFGDLIGEEMGGMIEMMVSFLQEPAEDWLDRCDIDLSN